MVVWWSEPIDDESVSSSLRFAFRLETFYFHTIFLYIVIDAITVNDLVYQDLL